ncbi:MAG TPA: hypothetical protein VIK14_01700 [Ignavibacteria bacterium]
MNSKLTHLFLKLDYRDKDKSSKKKFIGIAVGYLFTNLMLSLNYFFFFDYFSYAILSFTINIFLLSFIALNDFQSLFFAKTHIEVLKSLPLSSEDLFISKFISAFVYLLLIISAPIISQSIVFYFFEYNVYKSLVFLVTDYMFSFFSIGLILLLFMVVLLKFPRKSTSVMYILQFIFLIFVMYSSSLASKARLHERQSVLEFDFVKYSPQNLFALSIDNPFNLLISLGIFTATYLIFYFYVKSRYLEISDIVFSLDLKTKKRKPVKMFSGFNTFIQKTHLKNHLERASYNLIKNQMINSKTFKLRYVPLVFIPLVFCVIGILSDTRSYLIFTVDKGVPLEAGAVLMLTPSIIMTVMMISRLFVSNTKIADENSEDVEWIYQNLPVDNKKLFIKGILKFININFIIPVLLAATAILAVKIEMFPLILNMLFMGTMVFFVNSIYLLFDNRYPFVLQSTKYNSVTKIAEVFLTMFIGVAIFVVQIFIFKNVIFVIISILSISLLTYIFSKK